MSICYLFSKGGAACGSDSSDKKSQGPKGGGNAVKVSYWFLFFMLNINNMYMCYFWCT